LGDAASICDGPLCLQRAYADPGSDWKFAGERTGDDRDPANAPIHIRV